MLWYTVLCFLSIQNVLCTSNKAVLGVNRVNEAAIAKKRQDTITMCENYNHRQREKRETSAIGQKFYDEDEYKALLNNPPVNETRKQKQESDEQNEVEPSRRFMFAPLQLNQSRNELHLPASKNDWDWHKIWEYGIIPYYIDSESYDAMLVDIITRGFRYIEKVSCIRLLHLREPPADDSDLNWLHITNPGNIRQCVHSNDQKGNAGKQIVVFGYDCLSIGEIAHEIMHVLGFGHEHNRPDRDKYVVIEWDNIKAGYRRFFEIQKKNTTPSLDYDYDSVLHYPSRAFTANGKVTIRTKTEDKIGQRIGLSEKDIEKIHLIFEVECNRRDQNHLEKTCPKVMQNKDTNMKEAVQNADADDFDGTDYYEKRVWPYAIVNYGFSNPIEFTPEEMEQLSDVFRYIKEETNCIEFRQVPSSDDPQLRRHMDNVVQFERDPSSVCRCPPIGVPSDGSQVIKLSAGCFNSINSLLHFMCHILGFDHQHNAFDRDNYLSIIWDNVSGESMSDLQRVLPEEASLGFRYDYHSIMHYPWLQVTNGKKTIMYPVWNDGWAMGHWHGLSEIDIFKLKKVYKKHCQMRRNE